MTGREQTGWEVLGLCWAAVWRRLWTTRVQTVCVVFLIVAVFIALIPLMIVAGIVCLCLDRT